MKKKLQYLLVGMFALCVVGMASAQTAKAEVESNDSYDTANAVNIGSTISGYMSSYEDKDFYKMTAASDGKLTLTFHHTYQDESHSWDVSVYMYENGEYVKLSGTSIALNNQNENYVLPAVGMTSGKSYYVAVTGGSGVEGINYSIDTAIDTSGNYEKEGNDVYGSATSLAMNSSISGNLSTGDDKDYYQLKPTADGKMDITFGHVYQNSYSSWYVEVYMYEGGEYREQSSTSIALNDSTTQIALPAVGAVKDREYYVVVTRPSGGDDIVGVDYTISTSFSSILYEKETNDVYGNANELSLNTEISGNLSRGGDQDYYKFVATTAGNHTVSFSHTYEDAWCGWEVKIYRESNGTYTELSSTNISLSDAETVGLPVVEMVQNSTYYVQISENWSMVSDTPKGKDYKLKISQGSAVTNDKTKDSDATKKKKTSVSRPGRVSMYSYCSTTKKTLKLYWGNVSGASGYQIRFCKYKDMYGATTRKVNGQYNDTKTIRKCRRRTVYYVQVRAYKTVDGTTVYGKWSAKKKLKTK